MDQKPPTAVIESAHRGQRSGLPFDDTADFDDADRGFIGALEPCVVKAADGRVVWDNDVYSFLNTDAPTTVHPSLWRQSQLCAKQGLYEVVEGIYQVRGLDLSNVSFIEGDTGVIVIDPLVSTETAAAAAWRSTAPTEGIVPVSAVIYTHSHVDHFGGVLGVTTQADVDAGKVAIIAPEHFTEHAVQENVYAGTAMGRRAGYMYGGALARGPQGQVGCGLGQVASAGEVALIVPTVDIRETGETHTIDGVEIEFQMAPGTEAPAEMHFYFPKFRALCMAENATHNLHNLLTLRGALVRDPHGWAGYLTEAIDTFADRADVVFASHHWPTWGKDRIVEFLSLQRDLYAYLHDQTLAAAEPGLHRNRDRRDTSRCLRRWRRPGTPTATTVRSATTSRPSISATWAGSTATRAGCGRTRPRPSGPATSRRWAASTQVVAMARTAFDERRLPLGGNAARSRVFTDENHAAARELYADTLEQLAYGAENAVWRNFFLSGATELREGNFGTPTQPASPSMLAQLTPEQMFDTFAINVNGPRAWDLDVAVDVTFLDVDTNYRLTLRNGVLVYRKVAADGATAHATVKLANKLRLLTFAAGDADSPGLEVTRRRRRAAVDHRGARPAGPVVQHHHAVAAPSDLCAFRSGERNRTHTNRNRKLGNAAVHPDDRAAGVTRRVGRQNTVRRR